VWNMRPEAATRYLKRVARNFETYAKNHYVGALEVRDPDPLALLAGLRYVATRKPADSPAGLLEVFTTRRSGETAREIDRACLAALIATTKDRVQIARTLALIATRDKRLPVSGLCSDGLEQLGSAAFEALLDELSKPQPGSRCDKLVRLLAQLSQVRSPQPPSFWVHADEAERCGATAEWRRRLVVAGKLEQVTDTPPDDADDSADE